jgi:hypothetical protein
MFSKMADISRCQPFLDLSDAAAEAAAGEAATAATP